MTSLTKKNPVSLLNPRSYPSPKRSSLDGRGSPILALNGAWPPLYPRGLAVAAAITTTTKRKRKIRARTTKRLSVSHCATTSVRGGRNRRQDPIPSPSQSLSMPLRVETAPGTRRSTSPLALRMKISLFSTTPKKIERPDWIGFEPELLRYHSSYRGSWRGLPSRLS